MKASLGMVACPLIVLPFLGTAPRTLREDFEQPCLFVIFLELSD